MFYLGDNYKDRFVLPDPNEATAEFSMEDLADDMEGLTPPISPHQDRIWRSESV